MSRLKSAQDLYRPVVHDQSWKKLRKGSVDYNIFWTREIDRCINGFTPTGGTFITGVHYFYLNYCKIDLFNVKTGRKEINNPMFRDQDQEYFYEVDKARKEGYGLVVLKARRKGFAQPEDSIVQTPTGPKYMGDIDVGDQVVGSNGMPTNVIAVHKHGLKPVYKVRLKDGREVECCEDHLWTIIDNKGHKRTVDTKYLSNQKMKGNPGKNNCYNKFFIENTEPVQYPERELPVHPYLLGALISDGCLINSTFMISSKNGEIIPFIKNLLPKGVRIHNVDNQHYTLPSDAKDNLLTKYVRELGLNVYGEHKFIPEEYIYSGQYQRLELLRGLFDTDGSSSPNGSVRYVTTSKDLAEGIKLICHSLGIRVKMYEKKIKSKKDQYTLSLVTQEDLFYFPRKLQNVRKNREYGYNKVAIESVELTNSVKPQRCITVDADDSLYLTNNYVVTHNSFMNTVLLVHEWTFFKNSISGIGAQTEAYVSDFRRKLLNTYYALPPELRLSTLRNHSDLLFSGYKEKINGIHVEKGMKSQILFRVMEKPDMFRGTSLNWMVFEEAGEFKKLKEAFYANEECFREGSHQFGVPIVGGTSNNITNDANDFIHMYHNPEEFGCRSIFIPASKVYHGFFNYETGISDVEGATKDIERRANEKKKSTDKKLFYAFRQEMPLKPEHAFLSVGDTPFDIEKINNQLEFLSMSPKHDISFSADLNWPKDKFGKEKFGAMPELVPNESGVYNIVHRNLPKLKNVHVAGVDPYHVDDEFEEKGQKNFRESKGCMFVYRRFVDMNEPGDMPVAEYCDRPYSKELFYEGCLKLCIYYDSPILVENNDSGFLKYFQDKGFMRYLMKRPRSLDAPYSQATNTYGISMKTYQKRMLSELVDNYIRSQCGDIYFRALLDEFTKYGKKNVDRVMAFGISLIANESMLNSVKSSNEKPLDLSLPEFNSSGYMIRSDSESSGNSSMDNGVWDI